MVGTVSIQKEMYMYTRGRHEVNDLEYYSGIKKMVNVFSEELELKVSELDEQTKQILTTFVLE